MFSRICIYPTVALITLCTLYCPSLVVASDSADRAKGLLEACQKNMKVECDSRHTVTRTTTIIRKTGQKPVTQIQTTEVYMKKDPDSGKNWMKVIMDDGAAKREMITKGGTMYIKNPATGKYMVTQAPFEVDPFVNPMQSMEDFDSADVVGRENGKTVVRLRGGKISGEVAFIDVLVDEDEGVVTDVRGEGPNGEEVLTVTMEYASEGQGKRLKRTVTDSRSGIYAISAVMDAVKDERDTAMDNDLFKTE